MCDAVDVFLRELVVEGGDGVPDLFVAPSLSRRHTSALGCVGLAEPLLQSYLGHLPVGDLVIEHLEAVAPDERFQPRQRVPSSCVYSPLCSSEGLAERLARCFEPQVFRRGEVAVCRGHRDKCSFGGFRDGRWPALARQLPSGSHKRGAGSRFLVGPPPICARYVLM